MKTPTPFHLLCLDFESWIFSQKINNDHLNSSRLKTLDNKYTIKTLHYVLNLLEKYHQKITFFVIFKLEELYPGLIATILSQGHEVGWHGYSHTLLNNRQTLIQELQKSKSLLLKYKIKGFQAPNLAFFGTGYEILKNYGFNYSSSIYGNPNLIHKIDGVYEIPISTSNPNYNTNIEKINFDNLMKPQILLRSGLPFGSSYFWSLLGKSYYHKKLSQTNKTVNLFIHNWQIFPAKSDSPQYKPDEQISFFENPLYYPYTFNVSATFEYLLSHHKFGKCSDYLKQKLIHK